MNIYKPRGKTSEPIRDASFQLTGTEPLRVFCRRRAFVGSKSCTIGCAAVLDRFKFLRIDGASADRPTVMLYRTACGGKRECKVLESWMAQSGSDSDSNFGLASHGRLQLAYSSGLKIKFRSSRSDCMVKINTGLFRNSLEP